MKSPTLTVQYRPYVLTLARTNTGTWTATLRRIGDEPAAAPLVFASTHVLDGVDLAARVHLNDATPVLWVGTAAFEMPRKQLVRVKAWIDEQRAPLPVDGGAAEASGA